MRRRALLAASAASGGGIMFPVTIEEGQYYPEIINYLLEKYGLAYGSDKSPMPIEDEIYLGSSYSPWVGEGPVKYISIEEVPNTVGIKLYLANHTSTYMCATLNNSSASEYYGRAGKYFYD